MATESDAASALCAVLARIALAAWEANL